jgi:hypothetical protein
MTPHLSVFIDETSQVRIAGGNRGECNAAGK